jgi:hypothetical protein
MRPADGRTESMRLERLVWGFGSTTTLHTVANLAKFLLHVTEIGKGPSAQFWQL